MATAVAAVPRSGRAERDRATHQQRDVAHPGVARSAYRPAPAGGELAEAGHGVEAPRVAEQPVGGVANEQAERPAHLRP